MENVQQRERKGTYKRKVSKNRSKNKDISYISVLHQKISILFLSYKDKPSDDSDFRGKKIDEFFICSKKKRKD